MADDSLKPGHEGELGDVRVLLIFKCGQCGTEKTFRASDGDDLRCPSCGHRVEIPGEASLSVIQGQLDRVNASYKQLREFANKRSGHR